MGQWSWLGRPSGISSPTLMTGTTYNGLALWRVDASGGVERHDLLGPQVMVTYGFGNEVLASDLNGDGLLDLAVVDANVATGPALVVLVSQRDGVPVVEGRYPLPGVGSEVLAGDVNGDGATDLVVLGRSVEGGDGGAFVFLNKGVPAVTAIAAEPAATFPRPLSSVPTIPIHSIQARRSPLLVPTEAGDVDLTIYNVVGAAGAPGVEWSAGGG